MRQRALSVLLAGLVVVSILAGCSGKGNEGASSTPASGSKETSSASQSSGGTKELTLWTWKIAMAPGFEAAAEKFKEKTGITVKVEAFSPDDTYRQKVIGAANSGDLPDVIHWWATRGLGFENALVNMNDKVTDDFKSKFIGTAFNESLVRESDVRNWANDAQQSDVVKSLKVGDLHQIPLDVGGFFTIYANNEILKEVGLENQVPQNFEQFVEFSQKVSEGTDKAGFVFAAGLPDVYYNWMGRGIEATFLGVDKSVGLINRTEKMSDPENIKPLKAFESLVKSNSILDGAITKTIDDADLSFAAGEAAYLLGGTFTYGNLGAMGMDLEQVSSFTIPAMTGSKVTKPFELNPFTLTALAISKDSPNQDAAWELVQFLTADPEGATLLANGAYILPAANLGAQVSDLSPTLQSMYSSLSDEPSVVTQVDNWPDSIGRKLEWEELYKDMQKIMTGELTAEQVASNFDKNAANEAAKGS
ncbi:ABC transporter substrate-binding protein [Cohnella cellulosilytica]|uniref:ABC transporter substrate-binding protein n=1 Tax=Cohnella cellulosilytica TaxID=986710 RepID=A0ABW2F8N3_9BACL